MAYSNLEALRVGKEAIADKEAENRVEPRIQKMFADRQEKMNQETAQKDMMAQVLERGIHEGAKSGREDLMSELSFLDKINGARNRIGDGSATIEDYQFAHQGDIANEEYATEQQGLGLRKENAKQVQIEKVSDELINAKMSGAGPEEIDELMNRLGVTQDILPDIDRAVKEKVNQGAAQAQAVATQANAPQMNKEQEFMQSSAVERRNSPIQPGSILDETNQRQAELQNMFQQMAQPEQPQQ